MKIAILYICTGKYAQFFSGFYNSCEKYFLKGIANLEYFVFTDDMKLTEADNVHLFKRECQGFPLDSLFRFDMFLSIKDLLQDFEYIFFFNANMQVVEPVGEEILPKNEGLVAVLHPGYYNKWTILIPYERNKKSTAYIPPHKGPYKYYMGSLNGGKSADYLKLVETCSKNTHIDYDNGFIAMVHDESHLNKYLSEHECLALSPAYAYPEGKKFPFKPRILMVDKLKKDPEYFNKGLKRKANGHRTFIGKIKKAIGFIHRAIIWYI